MRRVAVLNGGLPEWLARGLPVDEAPADEAALAAPVRAARSPPPSSPRFHARPQARLPCQRASLQGQHAMLGRPAVTSDLVGVKAPDMPHPGPPLGVGLGWVVRCA